MTPANEQRLANALTLARVPLGVAVAATLERPIVALALVAVAALTDAADGRIARHARSRGATGTAGDWLDPACDKLFVAIAAIALAEHTGAWLALALLSARELLMLILAPLALALHRALPRRAGTLGKLATDAQLATIAALVIYQPAALPLAALAGALGLAAVAAYTRDTRSAPMPG